jgi:hypothetical protein
MKRLILFLVVCVSASSYSQYTFTSPYLQDPSLTIGYVDSCAQFWKKAYDPASGGFYMNINRSGSLIDGQGRVSRIRAARIGFPVRKRLGQHKRRMDERYQRCGQTHRARIE